MKLKDIFQVQGNTELLEQYKNTFQNLKDRFGGHFIREEIFESVLGSNGYARKTYSGKIKEGIELTELELSMILDNGYSHFGGSSSISPNRSFSVTIYTD